MKKCITDCNQFNNSVLNLKLTQVQISNRQWETSVDINRSAYVWDSAGIYKYFPKERRWDKGNEADEPPTSQPADWL